MGCNVKKIQESSQERENIKAIVFGMKQQYDMEFQFCTNANDNECLLGYNPRE